MSYFHLEKTKGEKTLIWHAEVEPEGITIKIGTKGKPMRTITIPAASCESGVTERLNTLVAQQVDIGFWICWELSSGSSKEILACQNVAAEQSLKLALEEVESTTCCSW